MAKTKKVQKPFYTGAEWTFNHIQTALEIVEEIGKDELRLDLYSNQIEIVNAEQMLDAYSSIGMPLMYGHWSYGKSFALNSNKYNKGHMGLAYEMVINSDPCINYLQEENTMTMQCLVLAHAGVGHNAVFKNNRLFQEWTDASSIIDYLVYAKDYIFKCEEKYGLANVEVILDAAHALMNNGVDRYKRPDRLTSAQEKARKEQAEIDRQASLNDLWRTLPYRNVAHDPVSQQYEDLKDRQKLLGMPQENLLYFLEKNSPILKDWQREVIQIVRKISQYFSPQGATKVLNEGFATWTHYHIMNRMHDKGLINDGSMLEFLHSHTGVTFQPGHDSPYYSGINPYALGFTIFKDIERMCKEPTKEDEQWFPEIVGTDYVETLKNAMSEYRDDSFIGQFLSPKVIRDMQLFSVTNDSDSEYYNISKVHNERGYKQIRSDLSFQYNMTNLIPNIQVVDVNLLGDRTLHLQHNMFQKKQLDRKSTRATLKYIRELWGYDVVLKEMQDNKVFYECGFKD